MIVVASRTTVFAVDPRTGQVREAEGLDAHRPSCLAGDPTTPGRVWCGSEDAGVFRSDDGGRSWNAAGLRDVHVTAVAVERRDGPAAGGPAAELRDAPGGGGPVTKARPARVWVGAEPSAIFRSDDGGGSWRRLEGLRDLPSSSEWSFPPRPQTHHVRWIACRPGDPDRIWAAIEAGALVTTPDGGDTWRDRVPDGPYDTHELAIHPDRPDHLRVAAGDGFFESQDGGRTWKSPEEGLEVGYLRSVAVQPDDRDVVVASASSSPRTAYVAGSADGRLYRREGTGPWRRAERGWPVAPNTISPLLAADAASGLLLAADERGVHASADGGRTWERLAGYPEQPDALRGLAPVVRG